MQIKGRIKYLSFEGGFWGIETKENNFVPLNMPEQLKADGIICSCRISVLDDVESIFGWGMPCRITSFNTTT